MNVTLYKRESRRYKTKSQWRYTETITIPIERILRVEHCSGVACYVNVQNGKDWNLHNQTTTHRVVGSAGFIRSYIIHLAKRHGIPVRLSLGSQEVK